MHLSETVYVNANKKDIQNLERTTREVSSLEGKEREPTWMARGFKHPLLIPAVQQIDPSVTCSTSLTICNCSDFWSQRGV